MTADPPERIVAAVERHPGVHFSRLAELTDCAVGQLQYHLRGLTEERRVSKESLYGRTHVFPSGYPADRRAANAVLRRETARGILLESLDREDARPAAVADALGIARSTLEWHCDRLVAEDLVAKERGDGGRVTLIVADRDRALALLRDVTPRADDRLVDRFTALVDDLLED